MYISLTAHLHFLDKWWSYWKIAFRAQGYSKSVFFRCNTHADSEIINGSQEVILKIPNTISHIGSKNLKRIIRTFKWLAVRIFDHCGWYANSEELYRILWYCYTSSRNTRIPCGHISLREWIWLHRKFCLSYLNCATSFTQPHQTTVSSIMPSLLPHKFLL